MKQKDIAVLGAIAFIAILISGVLSGAIFNGSKNHNLKAPTVDPISAQFPQVSSEQSYKPIFNNQALDPTQLIKIGTSQNSEPFNSPAPTQ